MRPSRLVMPAAVSAIGAGLTDLAVLPGRFHYSIVAGVVFLVLGVAQVGTGVAILRTRDRRLMLAAAVLGLAVVGWWALTRLTGWWMYAWWLAEDGAVGFTDGICAAVQAVSALLLGLAAARRPRRVMAWPVVATVALMLPVVVLTVAAVALETDGFRRFGDTPGRTLRVGDPPLAAGSTTSVTYCSPDGVRLSMDVWEPPAPARRPAPVAVYLHGGGHTFGNRHTDGLLSNHGGALFAPLRRELTGSGFVVVSVDYRLAPLARWPASIRDVACAIRFLRTFAAPLGIDPGRIGVWGSSAGGQLAALLGTANGAAGFDVGQYRDQSSAVQAVVNMLGPGDVDHFDDSGPLARFTLSLAFGSSHERRRAGSPLSYVDSLDPPFLLVHGTDDSDIPVRQSIEFADRLTAAGVPATLVLVPGAEHGLDTPGQDPSPEQLTHTVSAFFARTLSTA